MPRAVEPPEIGQIQKSQVLGGLHHRYFRKAAQVVNSTPDGTNDTDYSSFSASIFSRYVTL